MLRHVWGLLSHPQQEWTAIREERCTIGKCYLSHVVLLAAIPPISAFIGSSQVGWQIGFGDPVKLTTGSAAQIAVAFYLAMLAGVFIMGKAIHWMAQNWDVTPDLSRCVVTAAYTATPLFLAGFMAIYPVLWINMLVGLTALAYTVYLLYTGIPIVMGVSKEQGFLFATAVLTFGMVMLIGMLAVTVLLWGHGMAPAYTN
ncbi:MAG TPA: YIP1 family protein [Gammaproteobacteria bacterium]|nr:YIP1 family protein [Gammaproteobacteria bacterium]